ncbi:PH domain-containing protein [Bacillus haynesii]|uniref:PH domain-containing protein n=1 Tax=Bacillus haynesii TaxID=1925021 RepID=UPI0022818A6F|nr:PH domain-containing protein [Bacillus haynesii]MCY8574083.1 PH domain-containing protein [Bacillus haynesii]MCY8595145.1 PH domain-containing protein [Bacillus haynesii]MCY8612596.1 PH domain-containing protein [Bacillus haynesii]
MDKTKFSKKALKLIENAKQYLDSDETVESAIIGSYETDWMGQKTVKSNALFLATNKKIFFYAKRLTGYESETFPYSKISSFESGKKFLGHYINFYTSGNKVSMKWIQDGDIGNFINYVKEKIENEKHNTKSQSTSTPLVSIAEELKKLAELKESGILTEEEFINKKQQLLNS